VDPHTETQVTDAIDHPTYDSATASVANNWIETIILNYNFFCFQCLMTANN